MSGAFVGAPYIAATTMRIRRRNLVEDKISAANNEPGVDVCRATTWSRSCQTSDVRRDLHSLEPIAAPELG